MKFCYADPPYLGVSRRLYGRHHAQAADYDDPATHARLIQRLCDEFPDGWALSCHTPSLPSIRAMCPDDVRICAWVKPFCSFKPGVGVAFAWEPVLLRGGRKRTRAQPTVRDWVSANITLQRGMPGAKPVAFCHWLFDLLNVQSGDEFIDLFPGSGAVAAAWDGRREAMTGEPNLPLFSEPKRRIA